MFIVGPEVKVEEREDYTGYLPRLSSGGLAEGARESRDRRAAMASHVQINVNSLSPQRPCEGHWSRTDRFETLL